MKRIVDAMGSPVPDRLLQQGGEMIAGGKFWEFWRRHKRKVYVTLGVVGSGYLFYKLYDAYQCRLSILEREFAEDSEHDELIRAQLQVHFENIQRIADTTTLPHAVQYLSRRVAEELDILPLTERLLKGKDQPDTLTSSEKLELWEKLKIISFTRMVLSLWAMTILCLYIKVQVNILGRHLYIDTARDRGDSLLEETDLIDRDDEQKFLDSADFLPKKGMQTLICNIQAAATEVLKQKQLKDVFNASILHETFMQILDAFMSMRSYNVWIDYLMPVDAKYGKLAAFSSTDSTQISDVTRFEQLMAETRAVLLSSEFGHIAEVSLKTVLNVLMEDFEVQLGESNFRVGFPLARLLPRVAQMGQPLLEEPSNHKFIHVIKSIPEVERFFTLLFTNMPTL